MLPPIQIDCFIGSHPILKPVHMDINMPVNDSSAIAKFPDNHGSFPISYPVFCSGPAGSLYERGAFKDDSPAL